MIISFIFFDFLIIFLNSSSSVIFHTSTLVKAIHCSSFSELSGAHQNILKKLNSCIILFSKSPPKEIFFPGVKSGFNWTVL